MLGFYMGVAYVFLIIFGLAVVVTLLKKPNRVSRKKETPWWRAIVYFVLMMLFFLPLIAHRLITAKSTEDTVIGIVIALGMSIGTYLFIRGEVKLRKMKQASDTKKRQHPPYGQ